MTLREKVLELRAGGLADVTEILRALTRPTSTTTATTTARPAPAAERALRDLVVPALMTQPQWNTFARTGALEEAVKTRLEAKLKAAATADDKLNALVLERLVEIQRDRVTRKGGEPFAVAAGDDTRPDTLTVPGPSWWETNAPGQEPPSMHDIREILKTERNEP